MTDAPPRETLAERKCRQRDRPFAELFRNQYVVSRGPARKVEGWRQLSMSGWTLSHGDGLRVCRMQDAAGRLVGAVLGHALTAESALVEDGYALPAAEGDADFADRAEAVITGFAGKYVVLLLTASLARVYPDAACDMPVLYRPDAKTLASSLGLLVDRLDPNRHALVADVLRGRCSTGLGQTPDRRVRRLIGGHALEFPGFTLRRVWPKPDTVTHLPEAEIPAALDEIAARLSRHLACLAQNFDCVLPLTGGRDSRMLLACLLPEIDAIKEISGYAFHNPSRIDNARAREVLAPLKLPFKKYYKEAASASQKRDLRLKQGWSVTRAEIAALAMLEKYPKDHLILRGGILELLRANQWRRPKFVGKPYNLVHGTRRLRLGTGDAYENASVWGPALKHWLASLPEPARDKSYDYAAVELWLPHSLGAYYVGFHRTPFINPFNDRRLIELAIAMPTPERMSGEIVRRFLTQTRPELLAVPFH